MPQKSRKEKERAAQRRASGQYRIPIGPQTVEAPAPERTVGVESKTPSASSVSWAKPAAQPGVIKYDYSYVYSDLKRIAAIAGFCLAIMVVLALVLARG